MPDNILDFVPRRKPKKPTVCPRCKSEQIMKIIYGLPIEELLQTDRDDIALGGCIVTPDSPSWRCKACDWEF